MSDEEAKPETADTVKDVPTKAEIATADTVKDVPLAKTMTSAANLPGKRNWLEPESRSRRILIGLGIYLACFVIYGIMAGDRMARHTPYNHFALMADAWIHGRHDLGGQPPGYAGMNDFALFEGKWFISFPPFPAMLMLPLVWVAGSAENFRDGQFIVWLAGIGPAVLFLALEKLRRTARSERSEVENIRLALLFAFGTVYFFSAVQGTVWFAGHVVGVGLMALFALFALDAEQPALAGLMCGFLFLTRATTPLVAVFFAFEAARVAFEGAHKRALPTEGDLVQRLGALVNGIDRAIFTRLVIRFALPVLGCIIFASWLNNARFHDPAPWAFGHEYLQVGWKTRIDRWGLFSFHFLPRNLAVMLGSLPWKPPPSEAKVPFDILGISFQVSHWQVSGHGLALWWTTPLYLWLIRPKTVNFLWGALGLAALGPLVMNLLYQNSGWFQFGYRFSNDYAVFLFLLLAISTPKLSRAFWIAAAWAVAWNAFGAASFERPKFEAFYSHDPGPGVRKWGGAATLDLVFPAD